MMGTTGEKEKCNESCQVIIPESCRLDNRLLFELSNLVCMFIAGQGATSHSVFLVNFKAQVV